MCADLVAAFAAKYLAGCKVLGNDVEHIGLADRGVQPGLAGPDPDYPDLRVHDKR
ncbi:hypothetical protein D3C72_1476140 [compost metagenome]